MIEVIVIHTRGDGDLLVNGEVKPKDGVCLNSDLVTNTLMQSFKILIADGQKVTLEETPR